MYNYRFKLFSLFLFVFFQFCSELNAQSDFRVGYIITGNGVTIRGEIEFRSKARSYSSCWFRKDGKITEYNSSELKGYGIMDDSYFASGIVRNEFAEVLVEGEFSLYKWNDVYYIRRPEGDTLKLETARVEYIVDDVPYSGMDNRWRGILMYMASEYPSICSRIENIAFQERDITEIVIELNKYSESNYTVYKEKKPWQKTDISLLGGVQFSSLAFLEKPSYLINNQYTSVGPSAGVAFTVSSPRLSEKWAFEPEILVSRSVYSLLSTVSNQTLTEYQDVRMAMTEISVPLMIRYLFADKKYTLIFDGGAVLTYQFITENSRIDETVYSNTVFTVEGQVMGLSPTMAGYIMGATMLRDFGKFRAGISIRYRSENSASINNATVIRRSSLSLIITRNEKK